MATIRHHIQIDRSPDEVWKAVTDSNAWPSWFPGLDAVTVEADGSGRTINLGGMDVPEDIVTNDDGLRRFQYRIRPGLLPLEYHLGTLDVLPSGEGSIVVYSTEILPDDGAALIGPATEAAVAGLKAHLEG
jgi:hypothetical protein